MNFSKLRIAAPGPPAAGGRPAAAPGGQRNRDAGTPPPLEHKRRFTETPPECTRLHIMKYKSR